MNVLQQEGISEDCNLETICAYLKDLNEWVSWVHDRLMDPAYQGKATDSIMAMDQRVPKKKPTWPPQ